MMTKTTMTRRESPLSRGQFQSNAGWSWGFYPGYYSLASGYGAMSTATPSAEPTIVGYEGGNIDAVAQG